MANVDKMYTYLRGFLSGAGMNEALNALQYARKAHEGQMRRDGTPYIVHPLGMACYAVALGLRDENIISTILLHDVVEDCDKQVEYLPVNDTVKRAVKYMTITTFDTDTSKIETKCRYFNELLDSREALICKALDRYNNLTDMPAKFTTDGTAKNIAETEVLLLPIMKKAKEMQRARQSFIYGEDNEDGSVRFMGCVRNGIDEQTAQKIFDDMDAFAQYAFNKSHAAAYSFVTYQTAYLKCLYPAQFMAALISSVMDNSNKVAAYINNCTQKGIKILPPDINKSDADFSVEGNNIRFGLTTIKNVGESFVRNLVKERQQNGEFKSLRDFASRMIGELNKRSVECLIKSGAFDTLNGTRAQFLSVYEEIIDSESRAGKNNIAGQITFFGEEENKEDIFPANVKEYSQRELLNMEKEVAGIYLSGHPLDEFREDIHKMKYPSCGEIIDDDSEYTDGSEISLVGIISARRDKLTRSNTNMSFITIEDFTGSMEVIVFPKVLTRLDSVLTENSIVMLHGRLDIKDEEETKLILDSAAPFAGAVETLILSLSDENLKKLDKIRACIFKHPGAYPVEIECSYGRIAVNKVLADASPDLIAEINTICGENVAWLKK